MQVIAIILVFIGHSTRIFPKWAFFYSPVRSDLMHNINIIIYSFHMALFVFISGFLFANSFSSSNITISQYIKKRFKRLIIPFYLFGIFWNIPIWKLGNVYPDFTVIQKIKFIFLGMNNGHLWFLAMLFCLTTIFLLIERLILKKTNIFWGLLIFIPVYFLNVHGKNSYYQIFRVNLFITYFYIGYLCFYYRNIIIPFIEQNYLKISVILSIIWILLEAKLVYAGSLDKSFSLITAIVAILLIFSTAKLIENRYENYLTNAKWFNFIAGNSFLLYIFHEPIMFAILRFIKYGKGLIPIETVLICFIGTSILTYIFVLIYKKFVNL